MDTLNEAIQEIEDKMTTETERPPKLVMSLDCAKEQRNNDVESLLRHHKLLGAILSRHQTTINKRWLKKTNNQRRKIVLEAWDAGTKMAPSHRPDFRARRKLIEGKGTVGEHRDAFMMPYINQKDLVSPKTLLRFLTSRACHHPAEFALADANAMGLGISRPDFFEILGVPGMEMRFNGNRSVKEYAKLVPCLDERATRLGDWCQHELCGVNVGHGLLVLQAQQRTMTFLVACTKLILHDIDLSDEGVTPGLLQPALSLPNEPEPAPTSLMATIVEAPYGPPVHGPFDDLVTLLAAKRDEAADHLWSLREDPSYFAAHMFERQEHYMKERADLAKFPEELPDKEKHCVNLLVNSIGDAYCRFEEYAVLLQQADKLRQIPMNGPRFRGLCWEAIMHTGAVSRMLFELTVKETIKRQCERIHDEFPASPAMRARTKRFMACVDVKCVMDGLGPFKYQPLADRSWLSLLDAMGILGHGDPEVSTIGVTTIVDELHGYIDSKAEARDLISPLMASHISDMAINGECLRKAKCHPWSKVFFETAHFESFRNESKSEQLRTEFILSELSKSLSVSSHLITPTYEDASAKVSYPIGKCVNRANTETMRKAENNLDFFWRVFDGTTRLNIQGTAVDKMLAEPRELYRTPAWVEPTVTPQPPGCAVSKPPINFHSDLQERTEKTLLKESPVSTSKPKQKTRGAVIPKDEELHRNIEAEEGLQAGPTTKKPNFRVDKHALMVFQTIFFTKSVHATPGEVAWRDFLHAMDAIGFASQKLAGSIWHFSPVDSDIERSIQFHEPHPSGKMPYRDARRIGRRLTRAYGWDGDMFALNEKSG